MTSPDNCMTDDNGSKNPEEAQTMKSRNRHNDILSPLIGDFGFWQFCIILVSNLIRIPVCWHQLSIIFLAPPVEFWCTSGVSTNHSCFSDDGTVCSKFNYSRTIFKETIVTEWDLICGRENRVYLAQSTFMLGTVVGSLIFGYFADKFGRKMPFLLSMALMVIFGFATGFSSSYGQFLFFRLCDAVATGGSMLISFVIGLEIVGPQWRSTALVISQFLFVLGHLSLPGVSFYFRHWRHFQWAISLPILAIFAIYWVMPQSPRWLLTAGKVDEAIDILQKAAVANGLPHIRPSEMETLRRQADHKIQKLSFFDLFKFKFLRRNVLTLSYSWIVSAFCYFGLMQLLGQLRGDIFSNIAVGGAIQLPGLLIGVLGSEKIGRRKTLIFGQFISGLCCILLAFLPHGLIMERWVDVIIIAFAITGMLVCISVNFLIGGELFPTVIRTLALGFSSTVGRIGTVIAPFALRNSSLEIFIPLIIFGSISCTGGFLCFLLPETKNSCLPDTIEEGERGFEKRVSEKSYALFAQIDRRGQVTFERMII